MNDKLLFQLADEMHSSWDEGKPLRVEELVARHPGTESNHELMVRLICVEALKHVEKGEKIEPEEYYRRFPQHAEALREHWAYEDDVRDFVEKKTGSTSAGSTEPYPGPGSDDGPPLLSAYHPLVPLDQGSYGAVYRARHRVLDVCHAVKVMHRCGQAEKQHYQDLFEREARVVARLNHPGVVRVMDCGEQDSRFYFIMELMEGGSLKARIKDQPPMPPLVAARLMEQVARGLHAAHQMDIVHRDLKPGNILLDKHGAAKVADFGLAKQIDAETSIGPGAGTIGTIQYMAPEQVVPRGAPAKEVDARADVFALGSVLFHLLTGRIVFQGEWDQIEKQLLDDDAPLAGDVHKPLLRTPAGIDLETICRICLEKNPARRYQSAEEVADRLQMVLARRRIPERPLRTWHKLRHFARRHRGKIAAAVLLLAAATAAAATRHYTDPERPRNLAEATLARHEPLFIKGDEELPGPFKWMGTNKGLLKLNKDKGQIEIESLGIAYLSLVHDTKNKQYEFSAEVRHLNDSGQLPSSVGLFLGGMEHRDDNNQMSTTAITVSYADRGGMLLRLEKLPKIVQKQIGKKTSTVQTRYAWLNGDSTSFKSIGKPLEFEPAFPALRKSLWRKVIVRVSDKVVESYWQSDLADDNTIQLVDRVTHAECVSAFLVLAETRKLVAPGLSKLPDLSASLGLYVAHGEAAFRKVVLQPLDFHKE